MPFIISYYRYVERQPTSNKVLRHSPYPPVPVRHGALLFRNSSESLQSPSAEASPQSGISDTFVSLRESFKENNDSGMRSQLTGLHEMNGEWNQDLSSGINYH